MLWWAKVDIGLIARASLQSRMAMCTSFFHPRCQDSNRNLKDRFFSPSSIPQKTLNESVQEKPPISSKYLIQLNSQITQLPDLKTSNLTKRQQEGFLLDNKTDSAFKLIICREDKAEAIKP